MVFNAIFNKFQLYCGRGEFYWRKPEKTTDFPQVTDKLYHIMVNRAPLTILYIYTVKHLE